jgi:hypothetical protein
LWRNKWENDAFGLVGSVAPDEEPAHCNEANGCQQGSKFEDKTVQSHGNDATAKQEHQQFHEQRHGQKYGTPLQVKP